MTIFRNWKVKYFYNSLFAQYMKYSNVMLCHLIEFINFPYRKVERFIYRFCLLKNVIFFLWRWLFEVNIDDIFFYNCFNGNISDTHLKRKVFWSTNLPPVSMQDLLQKQLPLWNIELNPCERNVIKSSIMMFVWFFYIINSKYMLAFMCFFPPQSTYHMLISFVTIL